MIDDFLGGRLAFDEFEEAYSTYYIEEMPSEELSEGGHEYFGDVHEKFSWTTASMTAEDRRYGYITRDEFRTWLAAQRASRPHG